MFQLAIWIFITDNTFNCRNNKWMWMEKQTGCICWFLRVPTIELSFLKVNKEKAKEEMKIEIMEGLAVSEIFGFWKHAHFV